MHLPEELGIGPCLRYVRQPQAYAGCAVRPDDLHPSPRTQRQTRGVGHVLDHGALLHPACYAAIILEERDEFPLGLRIALDVALCHGQAGMASEFLHVPETAPDLGDSARRTRNEGAAPGM